MKFTVDELLDFASKNEKNRWTTLRREIPFKLNVTGSGIEYTPSSGKRRPVPRVELQSFCDEFRKKRCSFSPGNYPDRFHKSYSLPLIKRFLDSRTH